MVRRGSFLRDTKYIQGMVIYVGKDAMIQKTKKSMEPKLTHNSLLFEKIHKHGNRYILFILVLSALLTLGSTIFTNTNEDQYAYHKYTKRSDFMGEAEDLFLVAISNLVLISHAIPSSIYIAVEIVRIYHKRALFSDNKLLKTESIKQVDFFKKITGNYDGDENQVSVMALQSSVLENLGQIDLLMTDKTGTMTKQRLRMMYIYYRGRTFMFDYVEKFNNSTRTYIST